VGEDDVAVFQEAGAPVSEGLVDRNVLPGDQFCRRQGRGPDLFDAGGSAHLVDGLYGPVYAPGEVDGGGPRRPDDPGGFSYVIEEGGWIGGRRPGRRQGDAVASGGAEGGSPPDPEREDRLAELADGADQYIFKPLGEEGLVDHPDGLFIFVPPDRPQGITRGGRSSQLRR
jgi:hypothetical protein